jgi:hypothetical protein
VEDVVLGNGAASRQLAPGGGDRLDRAAHLGLLLEQPITRGAVLRRLSWERDAHGSASIRSPGYRQHRSREIIAR